MIPRNISFCFPWLKSQKPIWSKQGYKLFYRGFTTKIQGKISTPQLTSRRQILDHGQPVNGLPSFRQKPERESFHMFPRPHSLFTPSIYVPPKCRDTQFNNPMVLPCFSLSFIHLWIDNLYFFFFYCFQLQNKHISVYKAQFHIPLHVFRFMCERHIFCFRLHCR